MPQSAAGRCSCRAPTREIVSAAYYVALGVLEFLNPHLELLRVSPL
jgi:hypothetical protein